LRTALGIPASTQPIAYLCVGYVSHFLQKPEREAAGRLPLMKLRDVRGPIDGIAAIRLIRCSACCDAEVNAVAYRCAI
jgi:hypothetical protein